MKLKKLIKRYFTKELEVNRELTVYDLFEYKHLDVKMVDYKTGKTLCDMKNLEFPVSYSQNACDIIASKYFRRAGVPNGLGYERSMKEVVHRLVGFWTAAALNEGLITTENMDIFYDEVAYLILDQRMAPNSPQWFNTGLKLTYDISKEPEGHFYYDIEKNKVVKSKDAYTRTQGSACFIISINDALLGDKSISEQLVTETRLFKHGSGTGSNFSTLRARGEKLSGGGTSSGLMSFLKVFDRNAGAIKSGGTTRRAAKIVCLNADHPEIEEFINWKVREEEKVVALGKMGYDTDFNGDAYETVSGQNSNNSIRFTNSFMNKVTGPDTDTSWELKGRVDSSINRFVSSKELWKKFNYASWRCADPAPQWHDTINAWNTCPLGEDGTEEEIDASNPCSEYHFLVDTACNLKSHNVVKYYDPVTGEFDVEGFVHAITLAQIILEVTIHWGQFPTEDIARRSYFFRTTGQGLANTGALHMIMGHAYDSDEARTFGATLMGIVTGQGYFVSSLMAERVGSFPKYEINKEPMLKVIRNHSRVAGVLDDDFEELEYAPVTISHDILNKENFNNLSIVLKEVWTNALIYGEKYGYRNAQVSVVAPTGTIALAMDCATTSIEPFFAHVVYKKLAGGGVMEIINPYIKVALEKLGYTEEQINDIEAYVLRKENVTENGFTYDKIIDGKIEGCPHLKEEHLPIFDTANTCGTGKRAIEPMAHVKYVAALTPLVSGAISKTVNLPNSATVEDFEKVHLESWRLGVKCIALYRDGCKASQPLNSTKNNTEKNLEDMSYAELLAITKELQNKLDKVNFDGSIEDVAATLIEEVPEGYKRVTCGDCASVAMIPNGTCYICLSCGSTTGCS
ncbi:vitamin B12-dependent ribonucleotide reductase [Alkaliphilus sp. B6464]|uniref:vitamin B12-dependent ribonucleotide reductase n=1 Tax=Alkaliphilus sp. B6464 TaxID=2731219 RepID=UPI001BA927D2|nr:vitamin B12-dependent ribonucleotide reductase [Alkaliphilus sp. B6464]QUH22046.1 vitamin B12-dependent ribonucleotide reductase [Alkaliphilus sp. B6464]